MGDTATALVDTGMPMGWDKLRTQIADTLAGRPLDYIFATHPEAPHMGNAGPLLEQYPGARLIGDLRNYHLYFPQFTHRLKSLRPGESVDLGGRRLQAVTATVRDLVNTLWAFDTGARVLFVSDGYPYTHDHTEDQCAMTSEELPEPPRTEDTSVVIEGALGWTRHVDAELIARDLDNMLARYAPRMIAPAHGGVITNPAAITDVFKSGLRRISGRAA
jgi:flavorubredoxin